MGARIVTVLTVAVGVLALGVCGLAVVVSVVGWTWANASRLDVLDDQAVAERLAPLVAVELMVMGETESES